MSDVFSPDIFCRGNAENQVFLRPDIGARLSQRAGRWRATATADGSSASDNARIGMRASLPGQRRIRAVRSVCATVRLISTEMVFLIGGGVPVGRERRFAVSHIQQIAMYNCHVVLQLTMTEIALAFGRDRTTVGHACARVEDRRDDQAYDMLVESIARVVGGVFMPRQH